MSLKRASIDSGIYQIVNTVNGKRYIGSATDMHSRWNGHRARLRKGNHHSAYLQKSWAKHGPESFRFERLLLCEVADLLLFEQAAIDAGNPEYNAVRFAGSTLGFKLSPETKAKIAARAVGRKRSPESVAKGSAAATGRKLAPEHAAKLIGNKHALGHKHTEEWKAANSLRHTGAKRPKSAEYRAKISAALKGIPHSPERRAKQALAQTGLKRRKYRTREAQQ